jgi:hypothetical protein
MAAREIGVSRTTVSGWNYTTVLNIIFLSLAAALGWRYFRYGGGWKMLRMMDTPMEHGHHGHHGSHGFAQSRAGLVRHEARVVASFAAVRASADPTAPSPLLSRVGPLGRSPAGLPARRSPRSDVQAPLALRSLRLPVGGCLFVTRSRGVVSCCRVAMLVYQSGYRTDFTEGQQSASACFRGSCDQRLLVPGVCSFTCPERSTGRGRARWNRDSSGAADSGSLGQA